MIITLKGCTATAFIGGLNFFKVSKGTVSGADVTISTSTINKDAATSTSAREIATVVLKSNYENLVVTVTMGGATVNWFANGKVTIPANTAVTGDIKISASATAVSGGVVDPEEPGTGGENSIEWYTGYDVLSTCSDESAASYGGFAYNNAAMNSKFEGKQINVISVCISKAGSFTVGIVDSQNQITDSDVVNISNTGVQTIELNKTLTVGTGCRPFVQAPSDTAKFKYEITNTIADFPTGMDAFVGVKTIQAFPKYNMNINFGYKQ